MKQIFGSEVMQIQPCQNGFLFVIKQEERDEKALISYKMMDFERMTIAPVTRNVYLLEKFGSQFERYEQNPEDFLQLRSVILPDRRLLTVDGKGVATVYGGDGYKQFQGDLTYCDCAPDHLVLGDGCIYASYPGAGAVILRMLKRAALHDHIVVVTRWYGGNHLGGDRFAAQYPFGTGNCIDSQGNKFDPRALTYSV